MMNKLIKILMISFTSLFFTVNAFAADVTMRISLQLPMKSHLGQNLLLFKKEVESRSNGEIKVEIYDSAQLYKDKEVPAAVGSGSYWFNEEVTGSRSGATGRVKRWDLDTYTLQVGITTGMFAPGETITGAKSGANYDIKVSAANTTTDKYKQNIDLETEADAILDFSETNPFGTY